MADYTTDREDLADLPPAPLGGTRAEAMQRLQIGLSGLAAMVLVVGLASIILERANEAEANTVPEAAATILPEPEARSDPLADTGVIPDLPDPQPSPELEVPILPAQAGALDDAQP